MKAWLFAHRGFVLPFLAFMLAGALGMAFLDKGECFLWVNARQSEPANQFWYAVTKMGEEYAYFILILVCLFFGFRYSLTLILVGIINPVISGLLKALFQHPRPYRFYAQAGNLEQIQWIEWLAPLTGLTSFPSGHAISAFALYGTMALFVKRQWVKAGFFAIALLIALSRIYLRCHFLQDIVFGAFVGFSIATGLYFISERYLVNVPFLSRRRSFR